MKRNYCKQCNNKLNLDEIDLCYKCKREYSERTLKRAKETLEEAKEQLERALKVGTPNLIRRLENIKKESLKQYLKQQSLVIFVH